MAEQNIYQKAWQRLLKEIERKTGWGKVELKQVMLECFTDSWYEEKYPEDMEKKTK